MTSAVKLFFDACCSKTLPRELLDFYSAEYPNLTTSHVLDYYKPETDDSVWLRPLKEDRSWIVISADRGCDGSKEKLPVICQEWKITHVLFTGTLLKSGKLIQKQALVTVWEQLMGLHRLPQGTRLKLGQHQSKGGIKSFALRLNNGKPLSQIGSP